MKIATTAVFALVVVLYAVAGGIGFHFLEKDNETYVRQDVTKRLALFFENKTCMSEADLLYVKQLLDTMFIGGVRFDEHGGLINGTRWDYETAIFVGIELLATVGYTKAAPKTTGGRVFAICFAVLGIPAFLLSAIGLGKLLNLAAEALIRLLSRLCRRGDDDDDDDYWPEDGRPPARMPRAAKEKFHRRRAIYRILIITIMGSGLFIFVPSAIFMQVEGWTYWEAVYYCTITLVTIGFGDFVPGYGQIPAWLSAGWYRLAVGCYIVIVIGWFAGVVAAFRGGIYAFAHKAERRIIEAVNVFHTTPQDPDLYVSQTGATSVVSILPAHGHPSSVDGWVRPRSGQPTNFGHDAHNSRVLTSNVKVYNS